MPAPAPDEAGRVGGFVQGTGRLVVLVGSSGAGRAALDRILGELPGHAVLVGNALASPLTLHRLLFQLGADLDDMLTGEDAAASLLRCLQDQAGPGGLAVLAVEDAHTLAPDALAALLQVPCAAAGDQPGRLLILAGHTELLDKLPRANDPAHTLLLRLDGEAAPAAVQAEPAARRIGPRARRLVLVAGALAAGILVLLALGRDRVAPGPVPQAAEAAPVEAPAVLAAPAPDPVPPSPAPPVPPTPAPPRATPLPRPAAVPSDADLRREFDAFLDRAGRDTAALSPASRAALFREYLDWRGAAPGRGQQP